MALNSIFKLWGKGKQKSLVDRIVELQELSPILHEELTTLNRPEQIKTLAEVFKRLPAARLDAIIEPLRAQDFPRQVVSAVKKNVNSIPMEAIMLISYFPAEEVVSLLIELLAVKNEQVRFEATQALIATKDPRVVSALMGVLAEPKSWLPARVTEIMAAYKKEAVPALMQAYQGATTDTQKTILEILTALADPRSEEFFIQGLHHQEAKLRQVAIVGLGTLKSPGAFTGLISLRNDPEDLVRLKTVQILGESLGKGVWPGLDREIYPFLLDNNWLVRNEAAEILAEMGLLSEDLLTMVKDTRYSQLDDQLKIAVERLIEGVQV